jgi:hypothetical protein
MRRLARGSSLAIASRRRSPSFRVSTRPNARRFFLQEQGPRDRDRSRTGIGPKFGQDPNRKLRMSVTVFFGADFTGEAPISDYQISDRQYNPRNEPGQSDLERMWRGGSVVDSEA